MRFSKTPPKWGKGRRIGRAELFGSAAGERRVKYFGTTWVEYQPHSQRAKVFGSDPAHLYESALAVVLSFVGEWLDGLGMHRVHGLGVSSEGEGALFLAASGTGKSTLALSLLKRTAVDLLSDDTPLVLSGARMASFPQRIATREKPKGFSDKYLRKFRRVEYGEKFVLGAEAFSDRIQTDVPIRQVFVTRRHVGEPALEAISRWRLAWPLAKWLVIGYETPQMWELFLRPSPADFGRKLGILRSRVSVAASLLRKAKAYRLVLGGDSEQNARFVEHFLGDKT